MARRSVHKIINNIRYIYVCSKYVRTFSDTIYVGLKSGDENEEGAVGARKDTKVEFRLPENVKARFAKAAKKEGMDLSGFLLAAGEERARAVDAEVPLMRDGQEAIPGFRYLVREGGKVKFRAHGALAIAAIVGMRAADDSVEDIAADLSLPLAAVLEAKHFFDTRPDEVERFFEQRH